METDYINKLVENKLRENMFQMSTNLEVNIAGDAFVFPADLEKRFLLVNARSEEAVSCSGVEDAIEGERPSLLSGMDIANDALSGSVCGSSNALREISGIQVFLALPNAVEWHCVFSLNRKNVGSEVLVVVPKDTNSLVQLVSLCRVVVLP